MKLYRTYKLLPFVLIIIQACKKESVTPPPSPPSPIIIQPPPAFGFYVVGYFPSYRTLSEVPDVKFRMCNVVNYAFFGVNSSGTLTVNNPTLVTQVITKAKTNNAKVFVAINDQSGDGKSNFKSMAATA